jgi:hypothetical protein
VQVGEILLKTETKPNKEQKIKTKYEMKIERETER